MSDVKIYNSYTTTGMLCGDKVIMEGGEGGHVSGWKNEIIMLMEVVLKSNLKGSLIWTFNVALEKDIGDHITYLLFSRR